PPLEQPASTARSTTADTSAGTRHPRIISSPRCSRTGAGYYDVRTRPGRWRAGVQERAKPSGRAPWRARPGGGAVGAVGATRGARGAWLAGPQSHRYHGGREGRSAAAYGRVAQLVEQGIENPRVGGSIPSPATIDETVWTSNPPGAGFFAPGPRGGAASRVRGRSGRAPAGPGRAPGPGVAYAIIVAMRQPVRAAGAGPAGPVLRTNRGVQSV